MALFGTCLHDFDDKDDDEVPCCECCLPTIRYFAHRTRHGLMCDDCYRKTRQKGK